MIPSSQDTHPSWSPDNQKIVISSTINDQNKEGLFILDISEEITDQNPKLLYDTSAIETEPDWSPIEDWIVFRQGSGPTSLICIISASISDPTCFDKTMGGKQPRWSPDGKWIIYSENVDGYDRLRYINIETIEVIRILDIVGSYPSWSP